MGFGEHGDLGLHALHHALEELEEEQEHVTDLRQRMEAAIALEMHNNKDNVTPKHAQRPPLVSLKIYYLRSQSVQLNVNIAKSMVSITI